MLSSYFALEQVKPYYVSFLQNVTLSKIRSLYVGLFLVRSSYVRLDPVILC